MPGAGGWISRVPRARILFACGLFLPALLAWNPPVDTAGPVTARLEVPSTINGPASGTLAIINDSSRDISGTFELRSIDGWTIAPADAPFTARAQNRVEVPFTIAPAADTYRALYPIHAFVRFDEDGTNYTAHPIAIVESRLGAARHMDSRTSPAVTLAAQDVGTIGAYAISVTREGLVRFRGNNAEVSFHGISPLNLARPAKLWIENGALKIQIATTGGGSRDNVYVGPWSAKATRIYAGQGNVIQNPATFYLDPDGHRLSTRYVGFDFPGLCILEATDVPPAGLEVNPDKRVYTLHAFESQTLTFIPAPDIESAVFHWREINGQHAAPGVPKLAGRFVFDIWEGKYAAGAEQLRRAFAYGLTDSVVIWHNWQRWGYDYRLPDIWPPNPDLGTVDDFRSLAKVCKDHGVLFAPHDNYIDFYPDADGFSYRDIAFGINGEPMRAWNNHWRGAQSYRWRPDSFQPFLERNLGQIRDAIAPTAYFVDVFSSMEPFDYWTDDGRHRTASETQRAWGEAFAWIRDFLGGAPTISEAGHDNLVGWLDGATAVMLRVAAPPQKGMVWTIQAEDAERIPWMDAVNHDRLIQHGAGYEDRYAEGLDKREHGIYSDDYISTEVLAGHPVMVSEPFSRDAVRIYWLLHDLGRALAMQHVTGFEFVGGNLHRQHITWSNGEVWVNRGADEWTVAGHVLPQYGYYAKVGGVESAVERTGEWSKSQASWFHDGYRIDRDDGAVRVTALPDTPRMIVRLNLPGSHTVEELNEDGRVVETEPVRREGDAILLTLDPSRFAYRLR